MTTLAPEIIAAVLDDPLPAHLTIHALGINTPLLWEEQRLHIGTPPSSC